MLYHKAQMKNSPTLSVIIPAYNEEKTIDKALKQVRARTEIFEIIVVDDGSEDKTGEVLTRHQNPRVKIVSHRQNKGKGRAVVTGLAQARGDYVLTQDADLEYYPSDYPKLLEPIMTGQAEVVFGSRFKAARKGYFAAQAGNWLLTQIANLLFGLSLTDSYTGYKLLPRKLFIDLNLESERFEVEAEIVAKLAKGGIQIIEVPINYRPRSYREGKKINFIDFLKGVATLIKIRLA